MRVSALFLPERKHSECNTLSLRLVALVFLFTLALGLLSVAAASREPSFVPFDSSTVPQGSRLGILVTYGKHGPFFNNTNLKRIDPAIRESTGTIQTLLESSLSNALKARGFSPVVLPSSGQAFGSSLAHEVQAATKGSSVEATIAVEAETWAEVSLKESSDPISSRYMLLRQPVLITHVSPMIVAPDGHVLGSGRCDVSHVFFSGRQVLGKDNKDLGEESADCILAALGLTTVSPRLAEKDAAQSGVFTGVWKLQPSVSKFQGSPVPVGETWQIQASGGYVTFTLDRTFSKGKSLQTSFRLEADGKPHPVARTDLKPLQEVFGFERTGLLWPNMVTLSPGPNVLDFTIWSKYGDLLAHGMWNMSADAKTMIVTQRGRESYQISHTNVSIYERQ